MLLSFVSRKVLTHQYQVVHQNRYVVTLMDIVAHPQSLRRKRRGIQPEEINRVTIFTQ